MIQRRFGESPGEWHEPSLSSGFSEALTVLFQNITEIRCITEAGSIVYFRRAEGL